MLNWSLDLCAHQPSRPWLAYYLSSKLDYTTSTSVTSHPIRELEQCVHVMRICTFLHGLFFFYPTFILNMRTQLHQEMSMTKKISSYALPAMGHHRYHQPSRMVPRSTQHGQNSQHKANMYHRFITRKLTDPRKRTTQSWSLTKKITLFSSKNQQIWLST